VKRAAVVVLGDIGRSPRMCNHAQEFAAAGYDTALIGYAPRAGTQTPPGVRILPLTPMRRAGDHRSKLAFLLISAIRMGLLFWQLTAALIREKPAVILVQNPPGFPTLTAAWIARLITGARVIVDWHNYGYTILALRLNERHPIVRLHAWYEFAAGRLCGKHHLCVSEAMREDLASRHGIEATVLYDRPTGPPAPRQPNVKLTAVCPAGWTSDEDMSILLDALDSLDPATATAWELHLTGDGPLRQSFEPRIAALRQRGIDIRTGFLPESEYRERIAGADLGISLHRSSSGLDLAMKVVDLFQHGVPVCAFDYGGAIREQIEPGKTGFLFRDAAGLAETIREITTDPHNLNEMRHRILHRWDRPNWSEAWSKVDVC
jgi:beta-1,4-mannosyltransferase